MYSANQDCIMLKSLKIKHLEVSKNEILKSKGSGIRLNDVKAYLNDPLKVEIKGNQISEMQRGHGIHIESSTCHLDSNLIQANEFDGVHITCHSHYS